MAGTKVQTDHGLQNIEDIQVGDLVLSKDEETGEIAYKPVEETFTRIASGTYKIYAGNDVYEATAEHPFWVEGKGWTEVQNLKIGDRFVTKEGKTVVVRDIVKKDEPTRVYNLRVADYHTYFVGEESVWSHNCGGKGTGKVKTYEQARNEALSWLKQRGFKSEKPTFGKFGYTKNESIGRQTNDGKVGFRIEHDSRSGAHINVWAGKEKGPHFKFDASEKTVKKIQKRFR